MRMESFSYIFAQAANVIYLLHHNSFWNEFITSFGVKIIDINSSINRPTNKSQPLKRAICGKLLYLQYFIIHY